MGNSVTKGRVEKNSRKAFRGSGMMNKEVARSSDHILPEEGTKIDEWELEKGTGKTREELVMGTRKVDLIVCTTKEQGPEYFRELLGPEGAAIEATIRIRRGGTIKDRQRLQGTRP